jgi:hypothetical protein
MLRHVIDNERSERTKESNHERSQSSRATRNLNHVRRSAREAFALLEESL